MVRASRGPDYASFETWDWINARSAALASELLTLVAAAEGAQVNGEDEVDLAIDVELETDDLVSRAHWTRAVEIAETLQDLESGPLPPSVEDALGRASAAADVLGIMAAPDHRSMA